LWRFSYTFFRPKNWATNSGYPSSEIEVYKEEATQAFLVRFGAAVEQTSSLYPKVNFSQLIPGKVVVDGELKEE